MTEQIKEMKAKARKHLRDAKAATDEYKRQCAMADYHVAMDIVALYKRFS